MTNKTYSDLASLIEALAGVDTFTTAEDAKVLALANRRLYQAYDASPNWPRYIVGAEARPATDGIISREYDAASGVRTGSAATRSGTTVTIVCTAAVSFVAGMEVTVSGLSGTEDPNVTATVTGLSTTTLENDTFTYELDDGTGTETYTGTATVTPVAVSDIANFSRVWGGSPFATSGSAYEYEFYVDVDGAHVIGNYDGLSGFWVSYKKEWPGPYQSGATDIPLEFFYYTAHATYADFLRMDGQVDKAMAEEQVAATYLITELDRAEHQKNVNNVQRRISTYVNRMSR